jgi:hypothetical protein
MYYATSRKAAGSRSDEVNEFLPIYLILLASFGSAVTQPLTKLSITSRKIMFPGSKARPVLRAEKLPAVREPII